jgi:DNA-binding Lrp family transcriptional regulator
LEEAGIVAGYRAELNLEKLGLPITAFISIKSFGHRCDEVRSLLQERPEIIECDRVTGNDHCFFHTSHRTSHILPVFLNYPQTRIRINP